MFWYALCLPVIEALELYIISTMLKIRSNERTEKTKHLKQAIMKKYTLSLVMMLVFLTGTILKAHSPAEEEGSGEILELAYPANLSALAADLSLAYKSVHPELQVRMNEIDPAEIQNGLDKGYLLLMSGPDPLSAVGSEIRRLNVGKEGVLALMNAANPQTELIREKGISPTEFHKVFAGEESTRYPGLVPYFVESGSEQIYVAEFLEISPADLEAKRVKSSKDLLEALQGDTRAVGFCSLSCIRDMQAAGQLDGLELVPVDMNENGILDPREDFYSCFPHLFHAIRVGKYPHIFFSRVYLLYAVNETSDEELAFMEWLLGPGQARLASAGILALEDSEAYLALRKTKEDQSERAEIPVGPASRALLPLFLLGLLVFVLLVLFLASRVAKAREQKAYRIRNAQEAGKTGEWKTDSRIPAGLYFDRSHTWSFLESSGLVKVGVDNFLQELAGNITAVRMKAAGDQVRKGETLLTLVQHGKHLEIKAPFSGVIREQNSRLHQEAGLINRSPFNDGWAYKIEPASWMDELHSFLMGGSYQEWIRKEMDRLKTFFTQLTDPALKGQAVPVMQDGGEMLPGLLEQAGPEVWEEFQQAFINKA